MFCAGGSRQSVRAIGCVEVVSRCGVSSYVKVNESRNRPGVAQRVPGCLGSQISMTFGSRRW